MITYHDLLDTHFLSLIEYLLTGTRARSPAGLASPVPGLTNSTRSFGAKRSAASLNVKSGVYALDMLGCRMLGEVKGTWDAAAAVPTIVQAIATPAGNHMARWTVTKPSGTYIWTGYADLWSPPERRAWQSMTE